MTNPSDKDPVSPGVAPSLEALTDQDLDRILRTNRGTSHTYPLLSATQQETARKDLSLYVERFQEGIGEREKLIAFFGGPQYQDADHTYTSLVDLFFVGSGNERELDCQEREDAGPGAWKVYALGSNQIGDEDIPVEDEDILDGSEDLDGAEDWERADTQEHNVITPPAPPVAPPAPRSGDYAPADPTPGLDFDDKEQTVTFLGADPGPGQVRVVSPTGAPVAVDRSLLNAQTGAVPIQKAPANGNAKLTRMLYHALAGTRESAPVSREAYDHVVGLASIFVGDDRLDYADLPRLGEVLREDGYFIVGDQLVGPQREGRDRLEGMAAVSRMGSDYIEGAIERTRTYARAQTTPPPPPLEDVVEEVAESSTAAATRDLVATISMGTGEEAQVYAGQPIPGVGEPDQEDTYQPRGDADSSDNFAAAMRNDPFARQVFEGYVEPPKVVTRVPVSQEDDWSQSDGHTIGMKPSSLGYNSADDDDEQGGIWQTIKPAVITVAVGAGIVALLAGYNALTNNQDTTSQPNVTEGSGYELDGGNNAN